MPVLEGSRQKKEMASSSAYDHAYCCGVSVVSGSGGITLCRISTHAMIMDWLNPRVSLITVPLCITFT
jgi:hypothetical protein